MGTLKGHEPCPCGKSSDAYSIDDEDGHGHCFSCGKSFYPDNHKNTSMSRSDSETAAKYAHEKDGDFTFEYIADRGISKETMQRYDVKTKIAADGRPVAIGFPYGPTAAKVRRLDQKAFYGVGDMSKATLFGMDKFQSGSARSVTITEGEYDALAAYQMLGSKYPVVSVRGATSGKRDCSDPATRAWLNSFEKIYLCFDNDEAGQAGVAAIAPLFDFNKVYHVKLTSRKDANEYLENNDEDAFRKAWYNAGRFLPDNIISSFSAIDNIIDDENQQKSVPLPDFLGGLQAKIGGLRQGEVVVFSAPRGVGKTEILRRLVAQLLKDTDDNIGQVFLEEDKLRQIQGIAGVEMKQPVHLEDSNVSKQEIKDAFRKAVKRDDRLHLLDHFGSEDPQVFLDAVRFLVVGCDCKWIFFDVIQMAVTGRQEDDERRALDYLSTRLRMLAKELNFGLILTSHENAAGGTRGSQNIENIANVIVRLNRAIAAETDAERNVTHATVTKNRHSGRAGPAGSFTYNEDTYSYQNGKELPH